MTYEIMTDYESLNKLTVKLLKVIATERGVTKSGRKAALINKIIAGPSEKSKNKRNTARNDEAIRIKWIVEKINYPNSEDGKHLKKDFENMYGREILRAEKTGTNKDHFDFWLVLKADENNPEIKVKVEEKGMIEYMAHIPETPTPWKQGVQRYNGTYNEFTVCNVFAKIWYDKVVRDIAVRDNYCPGVEIPSMEEWTDKDARRCGNPSSEYGITLKKTYREIHGATSMNGKSKSPCDYRKSVCPVFVEKFNSDNSLKQVTIRETQGALNYIMNEKEVWLQTSGSINGNFNFRWSKHIKPETITDVYASWNPGADIYLNFKAHNETNKSVDFKCIVRFGKGTGFSNIRCDVK